MLNNLDDGELPPFPGIRSRGSLPVANVCVYMCVRAHAQVFFFFFACDEREEFHPGLVSVRFAAARSLIVNVRKCALRNTSFDPVH